MSIRTKLLLYFLSISMLIIVVGMIFYFQLRNLIEPLTPQSIPLSVEQLRQTAEKNNITSRLLFRHILNEYYLENYIFTHEESSLQNYYMNESMVYQLLEKTKNINISLWNEATSLFQDIDEKHQTILKWIKENKSEMARKFISTAQYKNSVQNMTNLLVNYYNKSDITSDETAIVTIKLAVKNTSEILHNSLNTTLIIFFNAAVVALLLIAISTRAITRPIRLLKSNIEKMSAEHLDLTLNPELSQLKGEVGDLARSFSSLIDKLHTATVLKNELLTEIEYRKKIERKLKKTATTLQKTNLELDQFAYAASHDLRSPLRAIANLAEWIKEDCYDLLPKESRNQFDLIKKRAERLDMLIIGMLEYSRAGKIPAHIELVNIKILLAEIIDNLAPPENIKITVKPMPNIMTNKIALTEIFLNLLSNAVKYIDKPQGKITVACETIDKYYQFSVADNGPGIAPEFHDKIFEIFQTLQPRDTIESSGIGLAIVKKIVEKQGGKIWIESTVGQGTTFYFTWRKK